MSRTDFRPGSGTAFPHPPARGRRVPPPLSSSPAARDRSRRTPPAAICCITPVTAPAVSFSPDSSSCPFRSGRAGVFVERCRTETSNGPWATLVVAVRPMTAWTSAPRCRLATRGDVAQGPRRSRELVGQPGYPGTNQVAPDPWRNGSPRSAAGRPATQPVAVEQAAIKPSSQQRAVHHQPVQQQRSTTGPVAAGGLWLLRSFPGGTTLRISFHAVPSPADSQPKPPRPGRHPSDSSPSRFAAQEGQFGAPSPRSWPSSNARSARPGIRTSPPALGGPGRPAGHGGSGQDRLVLGTDQDQQAATRHPGPLRVPSPGR